ncbi:Bug family tripartite tricarboxylate transporter substrate binding protein [Aliihoeflea sp. PC F10.4]
MSFRNTVFAVLAATGACLAGPALSQDAQSYPNGPLTLVVPYAPGGSTDAAARLLAPLLSQEFGQPVIVENMGGAAGIVGTAAVAQSDPDGQRLLIHTSVIGIHPAFNPELTYDTETDLIPISVVAEGPFVLVANPEVPANTVEELVAYAQENPGLLNFGSAGSGSSGHLIGELFKLETETDMVHIPYNGGGPSQVGLMANEVQVVFDTLTSIPLIRDGQMKALAVTSDERWPELPDVPTLGEAGYLSAASTNIWIGAFAPAGTPADIVDKISSAIAKAGEDEEFVRRLAGSGMTPVGSTPQEANDQLAADIAQWRELQATGRVVLEQ